MFNIAPCAISTARIIIAILGSHIFASLLYCTLNPESLHIFIGRYLGIDMMPLKNQSQRHRQHKESDSAYGNQNYN